MASDETKKKYEARWQAFHFLEKNNKDNPKKRVEGIRGLLAQVTLATDTKMLPPSAGFDLYLQEYERYATAMDSTEEEGGVNNYASMVLGSLNNHSNRSKDWSSSLTDHSRLTSLPCVQKFLMDTQKASSHLLPQNHENLRHDLKDTAAEDEENFKKLLSQRAKERENMKKNPPPHNRAVTNAQGSNLGAFNSAAFGQYGTDSLGSRNRANMQQRFPTCDPTMRCDSPSSGPQRFPPPSAFSGGPSRFPSGGAATYRRGEPLKRKQQCEEEEDAGENDPTGASMFKTAKEQLIINQKTKHRNRGGGTTGNNISTSTYGTQKKSLGTRRGINSKFVPPVINREEEDQQPSLVRKALGQKTDGHGEGGEDMDERLKNIDPKMVEVIMNEIMDHGAPVSWDDIAGLEFAKKTIKEIVVWPMLRPDIFTGLRGPPKGLLLFGPPGTGKTLIGKCIASQSKSTFFSISASSLTSKWVGEGEKMVRALFAVARVHQPAVIFIDEIDSLLSQRSTDENEASRRIKTEFLVQLDGATTGETDRILVVGATNRPQEIDEAARRRFVKRLYIPLPEAAARQRLVEHLMSTQAHHLSEQELANLVTHTDGYSGADMANLCREAALGPIRSVAFEEIENIAADQVRPILYEDFESALKQVRASVSQDDLDLYIGWNKQYGSWAI